jgi:hypothetical protein
LVDHRCLGDSRYGGDGDCDGARGRGFATSTAATSTKCSLAAISAVVAGAAAEAMG